METSNLFLKDIPLYWTTCEKSKDRHPRINSMLNDIGVSGQMIEGPITTPYTIGVAKGYLQALRITKPPFTILEDDATLINYDYNFNDPISYPNDADALYLGTSIYGRLQNKTILNGTISAHYNLKILKIFNMLGFHAVTYFSEKYISHVENLLLDFIRNPIGGCDDPIADSMWRYNVYCLKTPIFYQKDGRSDDATKLPINILL